MSPRLELFTAGLAVASLVTSVTWVAARRIENYGIIDAVWAFLFTAHALLFAFLPGTPTGPRHFIFLAMVAAWSLRLGGYLARRIASHHPEEDSRYVGLRKEYGDAAPWRFFLFFQYQAWSVSFLTVPFLLVLSDETAELSPLVITGFMIWLVGFGGEALADWQMARFRADPASRGGICEVGLWRYSRHPNYFFECVIWTGFYVYALASPGGWSTVYAPLTILLLVTKVTGIPPAERQSVERRGEAYRAYQRRVSAFVPWFRREGR